MFQPRLPLNSSFRRRRNLFKHGGHPNSHAPPERRRWAGPRTAGRARAFLHGQTRRAEPGVATGWLRGACWHCRAKAPRLASPWAQPVQWEAGLSTCHSGPHGRMSESLCTPAHTQGCLARGPSLGLPLTYRRDRCRRARLRPAGPGTCTLSRPTADQLEPGT